MNWTDRYRERVNAENLKRQAEPVQTKAKEILRMLEDLERYVYWAIEPEEQDSEYYGNTMIENAHALVDMAHEYRAALIANPPPKIPEDNPEDDLQSSR